MFANMTQAEAFLASRRHLGIKPGLHRVQQLLQASGNPERRMKSIHIAGTNGKGSTSAYLAQALTYNGWKTGSFISPTPGGFLESIQVDGKWMTEEEFIAAANRLLPVIAEMDKAKDHPSEFEIHVCIAFGHLAEHTDISVIEAGMGGRGMPRMSCSPFLVSLPISDLTISAFWEIRLQPLPRKRQASSNQEPQS